MSETEKDIERRRAATCSRSSDTPTITFDFRNAEWLASNPRFATFNSGGWFLLYDGAIITDGTVALPSIPSETAWRTMSHAPVDVFMQFLLHFKDELILIREREKGEARVAELETAIRSALLELYPPARPAMCRRILRAAMGEDPDQIYNAEPVSSANETSPSVGATE